MHPSQNNDKDYGIPVATPYTRDIEMTDAVSRHSPAKMRYHTEKSKRTGKRVVCYQSLVPDVTYKKPQKKRIGKTRLFKKKKKKKKI
jgi:hypothetical protein